MHLYDRTDVNDRLCRLPCCCPWPRSAIGIDVQFAAWVPLRWVWRRQRFGGNGSSGAGCSIGVGGTGVLPGQVSGSLK